MKYCPTCKTRYDEEILRFCMRDGTPLLEEDEPKFVELPSESMSNIEADEPDEVTVIRNKPDVPPAPSLIDEISFQPEDRPGQRIVVQTGQEQYSRQQSARVIPPYQRPQESNTVKVVILTIIGTIAVLAIGAAGFWMLSNGGSSNSNVVTNTNSENLNLNTNLGIDNSFNYNTNSNFNTNSNTNSLANANLRTPTPTPKPTATPSPSPTTSPDDDFDATPTPAQTPGATPTPVTMRPMTSPTPPRMNPSPRMNPTPPSNTAGRN